MAKEADLEELFAKRAEIDRALAEQMREVSVMFTDIVGSTEFFEKKGDVQGMALVKQHNDLLFPIVYRHRGKIVKTIGDAIMAVFDDPFAAIPCAADMQRAVANESWPDGMPLKIKIGVHAGRALVQRTGDKVSDVFGDTVNTAARIASRAAPEEILLSETFWNALPADRRNGLRAFRKGALELKGKSEALPTVAVIWREDGDVFEVTPVPSAVEGDAAPELFVLEVDRGPTGVRVSAMDGAADKGTVKAYEVAPLTPPQVDSLAKKFATWMHGGGAGSSYRDRVREQGAELFKAFISDRAKGRLAQTRLQYLRLHLDDSVVHVPWELLHDGREFLALRFAIGRVVAAKAAGSSDARIPAVSNEALALVVSNASGDLPGAAREGQAVADLLREGFAGEVKHIEGPVTKAAFLAALKGCRILHFAGHAQRGDANKTRGGFRLADGVATPEEVAAAVGVRAPSLVFANSCHSSTADGWSESYGLASAFLMRGTQHYIGPTWEVPDEDALAFALRFYEGALAGVAFGEAVRSARAFLFENHQQPLSFAGYVLYGEPRTAFPPHVARLSQAAVRARPAGPPPNPVRGGARVPLTVPSTDEFAKVEKKKAEGLKKKKAAKLARNVGIAIALGAGVAEMTGFNLSSFVGGAKTASIAGGGANANGTQVAMIATPPPVDAAIVHSGPVRVSILPFKQVGTDAELGFLTEGLSEALVTDFGMHPDIKLIERVQVELDIKELEFSQSKFVDPATRAAIGKIGGAEVVVIGSFQRAGKTVRATARFVNVETGEVLHAVKVEKPDTKLFDLQDALSAEVKSAAAVLKGRLRT